MNRNKTYQEKMTFEGGRVRFSALKSMLYGPIKHIAITGTKKRILTR